MLTLVSSGNVDTMTGDLYLSVMMANLFLLRLSEHQSQFSHHEVAVSMMMLMTTMMKIFKMKLEELLKADL